MCVCGYVFHYSTNAAIRKLSAFFYLSLFLTSDIHTNTKIDD